MAAGLVGMCVRLSTGKEYGFTDEKYLALADELDGYVKTLKDGAVEDTQAYLGIKSAFGLPKATDEEKAARRAAIEEAAVKAATVPLNNGRTALRIYNICKELEGNYNTATASDMEAGVLLARMAIYDTALNVEANLSLIKTPEKNAELAAAAQELKNSL